MNLPRTLILGSNSPRRQELLKAAGFDFEIQVKPIPEIIPAGMDPLLVAQHLSEQKAQALSDWWTENIVLTADTVVIVEDQILGKPENPQNAREMLQLMSGKQHLVVTGVSICADYKQVHFSDITEVEFRTLTSAEIREYVETYKPMDKAGAYGIQEWIGMIGIQRISGSYFNVVGLPTHRVYQELSRF